MTLCTPVCEACRQSTPCSCWRHPLYVSFGPYATNTLPSRRCPTCDGTGINPVAIYLLCPKCNGEKWLAP